MRRRIDNNVLMTGQRPEGGPALNQHWLFDMNCRNILNTNIKIIVVIAEGYEIM